jgi:cyanophycinase
MDDAIRGSLLIAGGGALPPDIKKRFVELASVSGRARILVLPMASSHPDTGPEQAAEFRDLGAAEARSVSLTRADAERDSSREVLDGVTGVWFTGGDQSRSTAAIGETPFLAALHDLYRGGVVLGGSSAGAAVMSLLMITGEEHRPLKEHPPDDQTDAFLTIERDNIVATRGLGFLPGTIVDQHFVRRKRHNRLLSLILEHPDLIGVGIDESTAVEVGANGVWKILGEGVVVIYDARDARVQTTGSLEAADVALHVLSAGSRYEPRNGAVDLQERRE